MLGIGWFGLGLLHDRLAGLCTGWIWCMVIGLLALVHLPPYSVYTHFFLVGWSQRVNPIKEKHGNLTNFCQNTYTSNSLSNYVYSLLWSTSQSLTVSILPSKYLSQMTNPFIFQTTCMMSHKYCHFAQHACAKYLRKIGLIYIGADSIMLRLIQ